MTITDDAKLLTYILNSCDPAIPADENNYVDCSAVRGGGDVIGDMLAKIVNSNGHPCLLFTGHVGCGKSSELIALKRRLDERQKERGLKPYFVVHFKALEYLNEYNVSSLELFLSIFEELETKLKTIGIPIEDLYIKKLWKKIAGIVPIVPPKEFEAGLGAIKGKFAFRTKDPQTLEELRDKMKAENTMLPQQINYVLGTIRPQVQNKGYHDILMILDDLEKIQTVDGSEKGMASWKSLFIDEAPKFTGLNATMICTFPLVLARRCGPELKQAYGAQPYVLPMIKVTERNGVTPYPEGVTQMKHILTHRLNGSMVEDVFTPLAVTRLIHYSGGHTRDFISAIQDCCSSFEILTLPLDEKLVLKWVSDSIGMYSTSVRDEWWESLLKLELDPEKRFDLSIPEHQEILEQNLVMEYVNGEEFGEEVDHASPWYAVHPIVRALRPFRSRLAKLQENFTAISASDLAAPSQKPSVNC